MQKCCYVIILLLLYMSVFSGNPPEINALSGLPAVAVLNNLIELKVFATTEAINKYDYDAVALSAVFSTPSGEMRQVDGFYYQHFTDAGNGLLVAEGDPYWKIRFTPDQAGTWGLSVQLADSNGVDNITGLTFEVPASVAPGFLRIPEGGRYFEVENQSPVFLVGENIAWANQPDGSDAMTYYLNKLAANYMNFAKLMMTPWGYQIEWGQGGLRNYGNRQKEAFLMDSIFNQAHNLGIYLQLAFSIHNELGIGYPAEDWTSNPYNVSNGGVCVEAHEFFTNTNARDAFKNRLRYLNARWGYSTNLMGWELLSEADNFPWYSDHKADIADWANTMASYLKSIDINNHLISVGWALTESNPTVWQHPAIGFTQMHIYNQVADIEGNVFRQIQLYQDLYDKPMVVGEFGLGHEGDSLVVWDPMGLAIHNALWTSAMSGAAVAVVPWFWENYIDLMNLYGIFTPVSQFLQNKISNYWPITSLHLRTTGESYSEWLIEPKYTNLTARSPSHAFRLHATGQMVPAADSMTQTLFGPASLFASLRQPPEISGFWEHEALFHVETGAQAIASVIQISVDDVVVLQETASAYATYTINVPQGQHLVKIDNVGAGFLSLLEISELRFENFLPPVRAFGMVTNNGTGMAWVHNRQHHWKYLHDQQTLPVPASGTVHLPVGSGAYAVEWYNAWDVTMIDSSAMIVATDSVLELPVNNLQRDVVVRVSRVLGDQGLADQTLDVHVFPNPSAEAVRFSIPLNDGSNIHMELFDAMGKKAWAGTLYPSAFGGQIYEWNGRDNNGLYCKSGIYLYKLTTSSGQTWSGRILRETH